MTQMKNKLIQTIGVTFAASTVVASAAGGAGDWADTLKNIGKVYKDKSNPFIQEVKFFGRAHYQWNYTDGESNGIDFSGNGGELRRFRFGTSVKFLNGFKAGVRANIEKGGFRNTSIGYDNLDELYLEYSKKDFAGFDNVKLGYGRYKVSFGGEEHSSSKKIKTIERTNLNNFYAPNRATGGKIGLSKNGVDYNFGVYSTDRDAETWAQWDGDKFYYASAEFDALNGEFIADLIYTDAGELNGDDDVLTYDWATSLTYTTELPGGVELFTNVTYGDTGNENVYGVVVMPSKFIVEDKLEAVFRYQWAHSNGGAVIRGSGSRGALAVARNEGAGFARGDDNHTFYAGLNYHIADHNAKILVGVEYEDLSGPAVDLEAVTYWAAFRAYF